MLSTENKKSTRESAFIHSPGASLYPPFPAVFPLRLHLLHCRRSAKLRPVYHPPFNLPQSSFVCRVQSVDNSIDNSPAGIHRFDPFLLYKMCHSPKNCRSRPAGFILPHHFRFRNTQMRYFSDQIRTFANENPFLPRK